MNTDRIAQVAEKLRTVPACATGNLIVWTIATFSEEARPFNTAEEALIETARLLDLTGYEAWQLLIPLTPCTYCNRAIHKANAGESLETLERTIKTGRVDWGCIHEKHSESRKWW